MRRPRRRRRLTVSVLFIAYSVFQAVYKPSNASEPIDKPAEETGPVFRPTNKPEIVAKEEPLEEKSPISPIAPETDNEKEKEGPPPEGGKNKMKGLPEDAEPDKKGQKDARYVEESDTDETRKKERPNWKGKPTVKFLRVNCSPPAIEQFPKPLMGQNARKHGGLIIHILGAMFTFIGLAIVCHEYFVSSIDRICEELKLAPDVADATFMAAGSSAPKLATVVIGVFWAHDDIGMSGVIGSAVFKIMFVISVCALWAGTVSHLNWWPLCRDCFFYAISIFVMLCTTANCIVTWPEALFMLIMYGTYCVALHFNTALERWAMTLPLPFKLPTREEKAALVTYKGAEADHSAPAQGNSAYAQVAGQTKETPQGDSPSYDGAYDNAAYNDESTPAWTNPAEDWDPDSAWDDTPAAAPAYYKAKECNPKTAIDPLVKPIGANFLQLAWWYLVFPIRWSCRHTMPDCRGRWYPVSFVMSILWISFYSYFMVWMITIICYTLGIPDTVMGLTFVAAGLSVPDALSSLAVIKEGYGDNAVSNAIGSNVFDILVSLGLPWFIQTAIIHPGSHVNVYHKGLIYSTLSLFSTVIFLVVATHANGWKLDRKYGAVLMVWYILFITLASLYELNVFGYCTHPDCISIY